jgi:hypothetical protein
MSKNERIKKYKNKTMGRKKNIKNEERKNRSDNNRVQQHHELIL